MKLQVKLPKSAVSKNIPRKGSRAVTVGASGGKQVGIVSLLDKGKKLLVVVDPMQQVKKQQQGYVVTLPYDDDGKVVDSTKTVADDVLALVPMFQDLNLKRQNQYELVNVEKKFKADVSFQEEEKVIETKTDKKITRRKVVRKIAGQKSWTMVSKTNFVDSLCLVDILVMELNNCGGGGWLITATQEPWISYLGIVKEWGHP